MIWHQLKQQRSIELISQKSIIQSCELPYMNGHHKRAYIWWWCKWYWNWWAKAILNNHPAYGLIAHVVVKSPGADPGGGWSRRTPPLWLRGGGKGKKKGGGKEPAYKKGAGVQPPEWKKNHKKNVKKNARAGSVPLSGTNIWWGRQYGRE